MTIIVLAIFVMALERRQSMYQNQVRKVKAVHYFYCQNGRQDLSRQFQKEIAQKNIDRARLFAGTIIAIEAALLLGNLYFSHQSAGFINSFQSTRYALMYVIMIGITGMCFYWASRFKTSLEQDKIKIAVVDWLVVVYLTFVMTWSAVITLFDQALYGGVSAYLTTLVIGSILFHVSSRKMLWPYIISLGTLGAGMPFFQPSSAVLLGHYINVGIFAILSWLISQTLYRNFVQDLASRWEIKDKNQLLKQINVQLSEEIIFRQKIQGELETANQELEKLSLKDDLTGIPNRRSLDQFLEREWNRAVREGSSISFLMIDIDYFKAFNDNYGHSSGDNCLIKVAQSIIAHCRRSTDFVARLGGEEFLFIAANIDEAGAVNLANHIREDIQDLNIIHEYSPVAPYLTVSIGITVISPVAEDQPQTSIDQADLAMYKAKQAGRNRVVIL
jgi:diguanylate cyclase (GGDEF)-like protein